MRNSQDLFANTEIAFKHKNNNELRKAYWLFKMVGNNFLTAIGPPVTKFALKLGLPVKGIIKKTIFQQFCGGESIEDCKPVVERLSQYHIGTILDYSVEGDDSEVSFDRACGQILRTIKLAEDNPDIPFTVFKPTGMGSFDLYAKVAAKTALAPEEKAAYERVLQRISKVCHEAFGRNVRLLIDAEHSWIQDEIDKTVMGLMEEYNKHEALIFNTYQLYRNDKLQSLREDIAYAKNNHFVIGAKLVRGAYMELERDRAEQHHYLSPINDNKKKTDHDYNAAILTCLDNLDSVEFMAGTHNEESSALLVNEIEKRGLPKSHGHIYFAQLYGMSDHISFNLADQGDNVVKYLTFGSVKEVLPYLFRRAKENTSVAGQAGRELKLLAAEIKRRKA